MQRGFKLGGKACLGFCFALGRLDLTRSALVFETTMRVFGELRSVVNPVHVPTAYATVSEKYCAWNTVNANEVLDFHHCIRVVGGSLRQASRYVS